MQDAAPPSFLTRCLIGPMLIFTAIVTPLVLMADPDHERSTSAMTSIMLVGTLVGLGLMYPNRLWWARRAGVAGLGVLIFALSVWIWIHVDDSPTARADARVSAFGVFAMPSCILALCLFYAIRGRWPWYRSNGDFMGTEILARIRGSEPGPDPSERLAGGAVGTPDGPWATVRIRGAGSRRTGFIYGLLVTPFVLLVCFPGMREHFRLVSPKFYVVASFCSIASALVGLVLNRKVLRKKVTWTVDGDGVHRRGTGIDDLDLPWDQIKRVKASKQVFGFETLELTISAVDGRTYDLSWTKDRSAMDAEFVRFSELVAGQVKR